MIMRMSLLSREFDVPQLAYKYLQAPTSETSHNLVKRLTYKLSDNADSSGGT